MRNNDNNDDSSFSDFVEHPRFGRGPRYTGLNPQSTVDGSVFLSWHSPVDCRIPNTAVAADVSKQVPSTIQVTHYFDVKKRCCTCRRPFIFFALEQRHWYENLKFELDADCVRCPPCRKQEQEIARVRRLYETLFHVQEPTFDQALTMAESSLFLVEQGVFRTRQLDRIQAVLNKLAPKNNTDRHRMNNFRMRLQQVKLDDD